MSDPQAPPSGDETPPEGTQPPAAEAAQAETPTDSVAEVAALAPADVAEDAAPAAEAPTSRPGLSPAACGAKLAELFPALFAAEGPPKPIKLRIHIDLQERAPGVFSRRALGPFFARYTTNNAYLKLLSTATQRFDLDGQPAGEVTEEHRAAAIAELARRREIAIAKRGAERAAERAASRPAPPSDRPPRERRPGTQAQHGQAQERGTGPADARPDRRPDRRGPGDRPPRTGRPPQGGPGRRADMPPRPAAAPHRPREEAPPMPEPQDPAQRERALLLRQFEGSPLTKSNFCVLRRIPQAELDAQLEQARRERAERGRR